MRKKRWLLVVCIFLLSAIVVSCVKKQEIINSKDLSESFVLRIIHVNDTHSHLNPLALTINKQKKGNSKILVGGYAYIADYVQKEKKQDKNILFLHAGDAVQGTLYYTFFQGIADITSLNLLSLDAMVLGNHEFDKGPEVLWQKFVSRANFPILCANIYFKKPNKLQSKIQKYIIMQIGREKVAILGLTTPDTQNISSPGNNIGFKDVKKVASDFVQLFKKMGINKVIVLSHLGYKQDIKLAREVEDIDIIVGGHSHTPLGKLEELGLPSEGPYPTLVYNHNKPVLVVTAWKWGYVLGNLKVAFDRRGVILENSWQKDSRIIFLLGSKTGVQGLTARQKAFFVSSQKKKKVEQNILDYSKEVEKLKKKVVGKVLKSLSNIRIPRKDKRNDLAPLVAKSMYLKTKYLGVDLALQNAGGVRTSLAKGPITVADIYEVLPFGNSLVLFELSGKELKTALEKAVDRALQGRTGPFPYLYGAKFKLRKANPLGRRIVDLVIYRNNRWEPLKLEEKYLLVTNSFVARGGDFYLDFKKIKAKEDLGFIDAEVFLEFVQEKKLLRGVEEEFYPLEEL